jgi:hypothetical protein
LLIGEAASVSGQGLVLPNRPVVMLKSNQGLITMMEYHMGYGMGDENIPYSKGFKGFDVLVGYQINRSFIIAAGTGVSVYNGGLLIPLFMDLRYTFYFSRVAPYLFADEGVLMKISSFDESVIFMNPGIGARYSISRKIAVNLATGILIQSGTTAMSGSMKQAVFINLKAGIVYKFWRKTNGYRIKRPH